MPSKNGRRGIFYTRLSGYYDTAFRWICLPRQHALMRTASFKPGSRILDLGVGTGMALHLYPRNCKVIGVDNSPAMLDQARKKAKYRGLANVELLEMDAHEIDRAFEPETFDYVVAAFVISVVNDPVKVLQNMKRVGKHGCLMLIVNRIKGGNEVVTACERMLEPLCSKLGWRTALDLPAALREAGLNVVQKRPCFPYDLYSIVHATNGVGAAGDGRQPGAMSD